MRKDLRGVNKEEMMDMFYEFDFNSYENKQAKKMIEEVSQKNKRLNDENTLLKLELERLKHKLENNKEASYNEILADYESRFIGADVNSIRSLATGEYLFSNEGNKLDYSGIFLYFIKGIEVEVRRRLDSSNKMTFGKIMDRLKKINELKTFVVALEKLDLIEARNKGVHRKHISKIECGKLRKLLLEDKWFDRLINVLNDMENEHKALTNETIVEKKCHIEDSEGYNDYVDYKGIRYFCLSATDGSYLLSRTNIPGGRVNLRGRQVIIDEIDYVIIDNLKIN